MRSITKKRQYCRLLSVILCVVLIALSFVSCDRGGVSLADGGHNQPPTTTRPPSGDLPDDMLSVDPNAPLVPGNPSNRPYYILNTRSRVIHTNCCGAARNISSANRAVEYNFYAALARGFTPCRTCLRDMEGATPPPDFVLPENDPPPNNTGETNNTNTPTPPNIPGHSYYIKNTNSRVIHTNLCGAARNMSQANRATTKDFMGALSDGFRVCMTCLRHKADVVPPERPPANPTQPPTNPPTQPPVNPPTQPPANPPQNPSQNPPNTPQHSYYIKNISSGVIHTNLCGSARNMAERNRAITNDFMGALSDGFRVCMTCLRHKADVVPPERPPAQPPTNPPTNPPNTPQHSYYVKNTNSRVIHTNLCSSARNMAERNRAITNDFMGALSNGFRVCMTCLRHKADVVPPPAQPDHSKQNGGRYVVHIPTGRIHLPTCGSAVHMHESNRRIVNDFAVAVSNGYIPCLHCFGGDCQHNHSGCCDTRFILNTNSRVIHLHTCGAARNIAERNRGYTDHLEDALLNGFRTCNTCMRN